MPAYFSWKHPLAGQVVLHVHALTSCIASLQDLHFGNNPGIPDSLCVAGLMGIGPLVRSLRNRCIERVHTAHSTDKIWP
eukprot:1148747-Pelagomonas_calceolata.AAC.4